MSYPEPRYHGDTGEASARLRPASQPPEVTYANGGTAHFLATTDTTDGQFGLYRWEMSAEPSGPGPHFHRTISESFYVLSGAVRLFDGNGWIDGAPGDFLFVPEGGIHGFRNESGEPASMLLLFAPGGPARGLLRDARPGLEGRGDVGGGTAGVLPPPRQSLGLRSSLA